MQIAVIAKIVGILLMGYSMVMLPPVLVSLLYSDGAHWSFVFSFVITLAAGISLWLATKKKQQELKTRDGFVITALFWTALSLFGALPFLLEDSFPMSVTDAIFESVSGLTTTGATVMAGLDQLPQSLQLYRQLLQWLGGIGIIVVAIAILPMLGIGGMQLFRAEIPGPMKDTKLTPRITGTAKALISIYGGLTLACTVSYRVAGMTWFDAIGHAFSTVSIGGFSNHDDSLGHYASQPAVLWVATFFMFASGVNFALHFFVWHSRSLRQYLNDPEFRFYAMTLLAGIAITVTYLVASDTYGVAEGFLHGTLQLVSIATTTGFSSANFNEWPSFLPFMMFIGAVMGGCSMSTAGGMKVIRVLLISRQGLREIYRLIHPNAVIPIKLGKKTVPDRVVDAVWGFFAVYMFAFVVVFLLLMAAGLDSLEALSAVIACLNNLGPGMGELSVTYGSINDSAKWIACFAMLLGRLEIFTLLVLFTPMFWRR